MSKRSDPKKRGEQIKKVWDEGRFIRDHSKCGTKGDKNPAKRLEVREKIGNANRGKLRSLEVRKQLSESHKGKKHSEETKEKIRTSQKLRRKKNI